MLKQKNLYYLLLILVLESGTNKSLEIGIKIKAIHKYALR